MNQDLIAKARDNTIRVSPLKLANIVRSIVNKKANSAVNQLKFSRGLKYFLDGFTELQEDVQNFVEKCKNLEDSKGYISEGLFEININSNYKFSSGPFAEKIFKIVNLQKNKIDILMGSLKTTINKKEFLFTPV